MKRAEKFSRQSIQDIILDEIGQLREEARHAKEQAIRAAVISAEHTQILRSIEKQTTATNGRLLKVEEKQEKLDDSLTFHRGGLYAAYILICLAISMFVYIR